LGKAYEADAKYDDAIIRFTLSANYHQRAKENQLGLALRSSVPQNDAAATAAQLAAGSDGTQAGPFSTELCVVLSLAGRHVEAAKMCNRVVKNNQNNAIAINALGKGRTAEEWP
jgi:hypothetical protein